MSSENRPARVLYENLDTSFVNLWGLLRYLSQRSFIGRVHVELDQYTADVFMNGSNTPMVHEVDRAAGSDVVEEAALHRLVLRVRESPGSITVLEGEAEAAAPQTSDKPSEIKESAPEVSEEETVTGTHVSGVPSVAAETAAYPLAALPQEMRSASPSTADAQVATPLPPATEAEWHDVVRVSGELVAGIDHVAAATGADFAGLFRASRIALADDYTFLDPMSNVFEYENFALNVNTTVPVNSYVTGVTESLRRVVDQLASGERSRRIRERVALELARVARKHNEALSRSGFKSQLDRIAGTKVI